MIKRKKTRQIKVGNVLVGGGAPIAIQSMTNTSTMDVTKTLNQIKSLKKAGCEIVRLAILNEKEIPSLKKICEKSVLPIVADIHFHYKLALAAIEAGVDKVRLNPGNIYKKREIKAVVDAAKAHDIPIRIGANSGSIKNPNSKSYKKGLSTAEQMVKSVLDYLEIFKELKFHNLAVSLKASNVVETVEAYQLMSKKCNYPLHVGITSAGNIKSGTIKSAMGIGALLLGGIGDTIRVSLTGNPVEEIKVAKEILQGAGIRNFNPELVSCPTCGRCKVDLIKIVNKMTPIINKLDKNVEVALMGCVVNGPGEARDADIGIASGIGEGVLFKKGKIVKKIKESEYINVIMDEIEKL